METAYWWSGYLGHRRACWWLNFVGHRPFGRGHLEVEWFGDKLEHEVPIRVLDRIGHNTWSEGGRTDDEKIDIQDTRFEKLWRSRITVARQRKQGEDPKMPRTE